jgi:hypothetical protein
MVPPSGRGALRLSGEARKYFIIAVDGGGIRGVIPSMLLRSLGDATILNADLFAGTSTGSLIAVGLAAGVGIGKITDTYLDPRACRTIFTPYQRIAPGVGELFFPRYTGEGLRQIIRECAPDTTLGALTRHVIAPTFLLDGGSSATPQWHATAFHNLPGPVGLGGYAEAPLVDAIMASAAAPTYFPPHRYAGRLFADGGIMAQNPAMVALAAATRAGLVGDGGVPFDRVSILSLGTGRNESSFPPGGRRLLPPYGLLGWSWPRARGRTTPAMPLTDAVFDGVAELTHYQVESIIGRANYRRAQLELGPVAVPLNECGIVHAPGGLVERTEQYMAGTEWGDITRWVRERLGQSKVSPPEESGGRR